MTSAQATRVNTTTPQPDKPDRQSPAWLERLKEYPQRTRQFLHEVRVEMKQVTWPSGGEVQSTTVVVILTTAFFAFFLWLVDIGAARMVGYILKAFRQQ